MAYYTPIVFPVEAFQWDGQQETLDHLQLQEEPLPDGTVEINELKGRAKVMVGDWIIKYGQTLFGKMSDRDFKRSYRKMP